MPENKHLRFLLQLLYVVLALLALWLTLQFLLPWFLPFLLALVLSALLEGAILFLTQRCALGRSVSAGLCTFALTALSVTALILLISRGWYELELLLGRLPTLLSDLPSLGHELEAWAYRFTVALPTQFQDFFQESIENTVSEGIALPSRFYDWLSGVVLRAITALPSFVLFLFTTLLATYFISASRPGLIQLCKSTIPTPWQPTLHGLSGQTRAALVGWLKAQGLLMLITFSQLTLGFLLLQVELALLLAALVALVDALPVFGAGTILLPWALFAFVSGENTLALGLFLLYVTIVVVRNLLEPRLIGSKLGLHPLIALMAMYLGFQIFGVLGLIFAPLVTVLARGLLYAIPPSSDAKTPSTE